MRKAIQYISIIIAIAATIGMTLHRFSNPDMTDIRWFIEYWHIWLAWFVVWVGSMIIYKR